MTSIFPAKSESLRDLPSSNLKFACITSGDIAAGALPVRVAGLGAAFIESGCEEIISGGDAISAGKNAEATATINKIAEPINPMRTGVQKDRCGELLEEVMCLGFYRHWKKLPKLQL
jgi:hypothetical protein